MQEKFPTHAQDLAKIQDVLTRHSLVDSKSLKRFAGQLKKIDKSLDHILAQYGKHHPRTLDEQKELVSTLTGRCHQLEIRRDVINLAEDAEALANSSPTRSHSDIAKNANLLRSRIDTFLEHNRPSPNNAKFIRFARACIEKAERHEPVIDPTKLRRNKKVVDLEYFKHKEPSKEAYELAEALYGLAGLLYQEKIKEFQDSLEKDFSKETRQEIRFHVHTCHGNLDKTSTLEERLAIIQGILGYAHDITDYYMDNTPYPAIIEIHNIFRDLAFIESQETD